MPEDKKVKQRQLAELKQRRDKIKEMGGKERVAAQTAKGKFTARARIDMLLDEGTFQEIGIFARNRNKGAYEDVPADGVITGYGKIDGRKVYLYAQDFTSMGGTMAEQQDTNCPFFCPGLGNQPPPGPESDRLRRFCPAVQFPEIPPCLTGQSRGR